MPNGTYGPQELPFEQYGGLTRDQYLNALMSLLYGSTYGWDERSQAEYDLAVQMLNAGYFGPSLPRFNEILGQVQQAISPYPNPPEIQTIGGYTFIVSKDATGKPTNYQSLGVAETGGLTDWQQAQVGQANRDYQFQLQQFEFQKQQAQWQRQQAMAPYGQMTAYERAQMGLQQQAYAAQTVALPAESWIEQWYRNNPQALGLGVSPPRYVPQSRSACRMTKEEYYKKFVQTSKKAVDIVKQWETGGLAPGTIGDIEMPLPGNWVYMGTPGERIVGTPQPITTNIGGGTQIPVSMLSSAAPQAAIPQYTNLLSRPAEIGYQPVGWQPPKTPKKKAKAQPRPTTPPAPPWLAGFVPGIRTGQPISKLPITAPSGQQWTATPPTVQAGLSGYGTWAGYNLPDILAQMYRMQPQTPYGVGGQRWQSAYQYA